MIRWLLGFFWVRGVSSEWLQEQARSECNQGWHGPRWRFPAEVKEQAKRERLSRIAQIRRQGWRKQA